MISPLRDLQLGLHGHGIEGLHREVADLTVPDVASSWYCRTPRQRSSANTVTCFVSQQPRPPGGIAEPAGCASFRDWRGQGEDGQNGGSVGPETTGAHGGTPEFGNIDERLPLQ